MSVANTPYSFQLEDCYNKWSEKHYKNLTASGQGGYENAWRYFESIKKVKMRDVKTSHFQSCIDEAEARFAFSVCAKIKSLGSQLCKFAMKDDLINKNYAQLIELTSYEHEETNPFTELEVKTLFEHDDIDNIKVILMMIYCGFRPSEFLSLQLFNIDLKQGFIRGGAKTEAGRNRIVPIHSSVKAYYEYFFAKAQEKGSVYLISNQAGNKFNVNNWRNRNFYKSLEAIGILRGKDDRHVTPYSCRHTFASMCDRVGINDNLIIKMVGHTSKKTTDKFYIHKTEKEMAEAVESL